MYGFLSALDFLNFIISAFPNFELQILRNWSICSYNVEKNVQKFILDKNTEQIA